MKYFILLILLSCTHSPKLLGEKSLAKKDAPSFLVDATAKETHITDIEYFIEHRADGVIYEVKYEKEGQEISLEYDAKGRFLESEEDIKFSSLPNKIQENMRSHLDQRFGHYKIHEAERRTLSSGKKLLEVEVSYKKGMMAVTFSEDGIFISETVEDMPEIETLN